MKHLLKRRGCKKRKVDYRDGQPLVDSSVSHTSQIFISLDLDVPFLLPSMNRDVSGQ